MQTVTSLDQGPSCPTNFRDGLEFNQFCRNLVLRDSRVAECPDFQRRMEGLRGIAIGEKRDNHIRTPWGGVVITSYDETTRAYEKYLLVESGTWLALESHAEKSETLKGEEGLGYLIYQEIPGSDYRVLVLSPGVEKTLPPGQKHCIVAASNLLVFESGVDPRGMDQDLIFDFEPDASLYVRAT